MPRLVYDTQSGCKIKMCRDPLRVSLTGNFLKYETNSYNERKKDI